MYLVIGNEYDPCARAVRIALERHHHTVVIDSNPFGAIGRLNWRFDSISSSVEYGLSHVGFGTDATLEGVFVRHFAGLQESDGWTADDLAYMRSESMAALLAWLHALDCPVIGRRSDDAWYRPTRPLPEWVSLLAACGLPTPRVVVTNVADAALHEHAWGGRATYQPLTSPRTYAIGGGGWAELAKVMQHVPVCLTEPLDAPLGAVTLACGQLFWSEPANHQRGCLEDGVRRVAERLESDFIQLNYANRADGPKFTTVNLAPVFDRHTDMEQVAIADRIVAQLVSSIVAAEVVS
jgi:hypothetical protein